MGLVVVVVGVLAEDDYLDGVEGGVPRPVGGEAEHVRIGLLTSWKGRKKWKTYQE